MQVDKVLKEKEGALVVEIRELEEGAGWQGRLRSCPKNWQGVHWLFFALLIAPDFKPGDDPTAAPVLCALALILSPPSAPVCLPMILRQKTMLL
eukprot:1140878-Pelagomonas_calceolata.AAC.4